MKKSARAARETTAAPGLLAPVDCFEVLCDALEAACEREILFVDFGSVQDEFLPRVDDTGSDLDSPAVGSGLHLVGSAASSSISVSVSSVSDSSSYSVRQMFL